MISCDIRIIFILFQAISVWFSNLIMNIYLILFNNFVLILFFIWIINLICFYVFFFKEANFIVCEGFYLGLGLTFYWTILFIPHLLSVLFFHVYYICIPHFRIIFCNFRLLSWRRRLLFQLFYFRLINWFWIGFFINFHKIIYQVSCILKFNKFSLNFL